MSTRGDKSGINVAELSFNIDFRNDKYQIGH